MSATRARVVQCRPRANCVVPQRGVRRRRQTRCGEGDACQLLQRLDGNHGSPAIRSVHGQALEPRSYTNTPVGINFLLLGYAHTEGDVGLDASTPVQDTRVRIDAGFLAYARSLDVWGLSGKVLAVLPVAEASGSAKVKGQGRDRDVFGLGDPLVRLSVNFYGAPRSH